MKYAKVVFVDSVTGIQCSESNPCMDGGLLPDLKNIQVLFNNDSQLRPDQPPNEAWYVVSCDDDADMSLSGVLAELTEEEKDNEYRLEMLRREVRSLEFVVQIHMDNTVRSRGYDNMFCLVTYLSSTNPKFASEAQAGLLWRDAVWNTTFIILNDILAGNRPLLTQREMIAELPTIQWPE